MLHEEEYRQTRPPPALQRRCPLCTLRGFSSTSCRRHSRWQLLSSDRWNSRSKRKPSYLPRRSGWPCGGSSSVVTGGTVDRSVNLLTCHAVPGGRAVAVDAPTHAEIGNLSHPLHGFDRPVAGLANDAGADVGAVIEVHEIG